MSDWHIINLFAPVFLPLITLGMLVMLGLVQDGKWSILLTPLRDGQLAWVGLGMCVNTLYELRHFAKPSLVGPYGDAMFWLVVLLLFAQAVVAAVTPLTTASLRQSPTEGRIFSEYRPMLLSLSLNIAAAWLYGLVHGAGQ